MGDYTVREVDATKTQVLNALKRLHVTCFPADEMPDFAGYWWLAYYEDKPVGFAGVKASVRIPQTGYMCRAGVHPDHRGQGLQRRMIQARIRKARKLGWVCLITDTLTDNPGSSNNLIHCGFKTFNPPEHWWLDDANVIYWRKLLIDGVA